MQRLPVALPVQAGPSLASSRSDRSPSLRIALAAGVPGRRLVLHGTGGPWVTIEGYEGQCLPDPGAGILSNAEDVPA